MSFASISFLVFFAAFLCLWPACRKSNGPRWALICVGSFIFYGWWEWRFAVLLFLTGGLDFFCARGIGERPLYRRWFLAASVVSNLGVLLFFKYAVLARHTLNGFGWLSPESWSFADHIVLPVGISFYTFQALSYTIDVYRGEIAPVRNLLHFWAYLSFFPQLVAGPIVRARSLLPQLMTAGVFSPAGRWSGLEDITVGFVKKLVVADNLAPFVTRIYVQAGADVGGAAWWAATACFAMQIYCDFSGYTDIARGVARWIGYELPENFRRPYGAVGLKEFWSRWHMSLSTWIRDYVYIPLGGSRHGVWRMHGNLWATMALSGLWHGANWTFVVWGLLHGLLLSLEKITQWPLRMAGTAWGRALTHVLTILLVVWTWTFFRADHLAQAVAINRQMFMNFSEGWRELVVELPINVMVGLGAAMMLSWGAHLCERGAWLSCIWYRYSLIIVGIIVAVFLRGPGDAFIYFQF